MRRFFSKPQRHLMLDKDYQRCVEDMEEEMRAPLKIVYTDPRFIEAGKRIMERSATEASARLEGNL